MTERQKKWVGKAIALLVLCLLAAALWQKFRNADRDNGLVSGNGRIEAVEIDVAAKMAGRVKDILVREGEFVVAAQVVALMDTEELNAQLRQAEGQMRQALSGVATALSQLGQRESEKEATEAMVAQRQAELEVTRKRERRITELAAQAIASEQAADDARAAAASAAAALSAAQAQVAAAEAGIASARSQVVGAQSAVEAARAVVARIQAEINDSSLKAPRDGRVQYRVAQPGEVVGAGGRVLNLIDLSDVYMTFFLPTEASGRIALGSEVRIVLDAAPQYVIPARASFIADVAQFTPKTVETASEREKLMFRIRAQISPELLKKYILQVKTGLPGVAYVNINPDTPWPEHLKVKLPE